MKSITLFSLRFVVLYALLLVAWSSLNGPVCSYLRVLGEWGYGGISDRRELDFESLTTAEHPFGVRVIIVNRSLMTAEGSGPVRNLDLDAEGLVSRPLVLLFALILSTPISWKRRFSAVLWGALWEHVIILLALAFFIWNESTEISLVSLTPFWKQIAVGFREMLVSQLGLSVPILLWIILIFRRGDERLISGPSQARIRP